MHLIHWLLTALVQIVKKKFHPYKVYSTIWSRPTMKRLHGQKNFFVIFPTFFKVYNKYWPTLPYSVHTYTHPKHQYGLPIAPFFLQICLAEAL
jgi:hypothetical protein